MQGLAQEPGPGPSWKRRGQGVGQNKRGERARPARAAIAGRNQRRMTLLVPFMVNAGVNFALGLLIAAFLGPAAFGLYAIAAATVVLLATAGLDWIKLAAVRFYSARTREAEPEIRATLDLVFIGAALLLCLVPAIVAAAGWRIGLPPALLAAAVAAGIGTGWFEYYGVLARALFLDRVYARLVLLRCAVALTVMVGLAWATREPLPVVLGGLAASLVAVLSVRAALSDGPLRPATFRRDWAREILRYGLPLVAGNAVYSLIPLLNRTWLAETHGLAEAGYFSLASDIGLKLFGTLATTVEILALRHVLRLDEISGRAAALAQIGRNIVLALAVVLPAAVGLWLVLPAFEKLVVPMAFRGHFAADMALLLPGFAALAAFQAALAPVFLLDKRTLATTLMALLALALNLILLVLLAPGHGAGAAPVAQSAALVAVMLLGVVLVLPRLPQAPPLRDTAIVLLATLAMAALLWPLQGRFAPAIELPLQILLGAGIYLGLVLGCDVGGWGRLLLARLRSRQRAR